MLGLGIGLFITAAVLISASTGIAIGRRLREMRRRNQRMRARLERVIHG